MRCDGVVQFFLFVQEPCSFESSLIDRGITGAAVLITALPRWVMLQVLQYCPSGNLKRHRNSTRTKQWQAHRGNAGFPKDAAAGLTMAFMALGWRRPGCLWGGKAVLGVVMTWALDSSYNGQAWSFGDIDWVSKKGYYSPSGILFWVPPPSFSLSHL